MTTNIDNIPSSEIYDVIIVGSGITGGWAAKEFCEKGLKTLMVERGRPVEHRKDYIGEGVKTWQQPYRGKVAQNLVETQHHVQQQCYAFNDSTKHFFNNDQDYPYSTSEGTKFSWIRGNQLGGKSLLWHRQSYRWSDLDFEANSKDGFGTEWPIRYKDLEPWYDYVETHVGISGSKEGIPQLPDSQFIEAFEFNSVEKRIKENLEKIYDDRKLIMGRCAHLTKPAEHHVKQGRGPCMARNECQKGCSFGAYFSTQSSTLPAAQKTDNLTVATNSIVHSVIYDEKSKRATGVRVIDCETMATREYYGKIVFLCASTLGTTQIMLNSVSKTFPNGIANSSGVLGHYLTDHCYNAGATADIPGFEDEYYSGRRPTSLYIPRFQNILDKNPKFLRGYAFSGEAYREPWWEFNNKPGFGVDFKNNIKQGGGWKFRVHASGEMLPRYENSVKLHATKKDKWGIPQLHFNCGYSENEKSMMEHAAQSAAEMFKALGFKNIHAYTKDDPMGLVIHEMGTARMGLDPETSVLNGNNQCHDVANLFVTDGACMASSAWQNPSLTYMALTARACDFAVKELKAGRL